MLTYFVTGGSGFLGSHVVDRLVDEGHDVRALVRNVETPRWLRTDGVTLVPGNLHDPRALCEGVSGADVVIHSAALTKARSEREMMHVNVEGTRLVLDACLERETPPVLVFISSQAAGGPSRDGNPVDETTDPDPRSSYGRSKIRAERLLLEQTDRLHVSIVRPPAIYGPRDDGFFFLFEQAQSGWMPHPSSARRISVAHVADVVAGIRLAEHGRGVYYVTDGVEHELLDVLRAIASAIDSRARIIDIPAPLFVAAVWVWERVLRLAGKLPPMTADRALDAVARDWICTDRRAREELHFTSRFTLDVGMRDTAEWYFAEGWLPR